MASIKGITFEDASLTHATTGFDSIQGTCTLDTTSKVKGTYSLRTAAVGGFGREDFTAQEQTFLSFYIFIAALPASTQARIAFIRIGTTIISSVRLTSAGKLQLRDPSNTQIGSDSSTTLSINTLYRIGLEYTNNGGGGADLMAAYVAVGDAAFGAAFASTSAATVGTDADRVEVGQGTSGTVADFYIDNIRIDDNSMPGPDSGLTTITTTYTSSGYILKEITNTLTASGYIKKEITSAYTAAGALRYEITNTYTASGLILKSITNTYTAQGYLQKTITNDYTASGYLQKTIETTYTAAGVISGPIITQYIASGYVTKQIDNNYTASGLIANQITNAFTAAALLANRIDIAYTAGASLFKEVTPAYTASGLIQKTITTTYTASGSISNIVTTTYTASGSLLTVKTNTYTASGYVSGAIVQQFYPYRNDRTDTSFLLCDPWGYVLREIQPDEYISASYTLALNAVTDASIVLPGNFPYDLIHHDGWLIPIRQMYGDVSYIDANTVFLVQSRSIINNQDGNRNVEIDAISGLSIANNRIVAYNSESVYANKTGKADLLMITYMRENFGDLALDPDRDVGSALILPPDDAIGPVVDISAASMRVDDVLRNIATDAGDQGTDIFFDIILHSIGSRRLAFRTWINSRGPDRSRANSDNAIILSQSAGTLDNVVLTDDYSRAYNFVYASGQGSGGYRVIKTASDPGLLTMGPFSRREHMGDARSTKSDIQVQAYARSSLRQGRPRQLFTADVPDSNQYGRLWTFGQKVSAEVDGMLFDAHLAVININIQNNTESIKAALRSEKLL